VAFKTIISQEINTLDDSQCRAILNEAGEEFTRRGTTENFLHLLINLAYRKGLEARQ